MDINVLLFEGFETLDAFGPVEVFGEVEDFNQSFFSPKGGIVKSSHGVSVYTQPLAEALPDGVLLIPGGAGKSALLEDRTFLAQLKTLADSAVSCLCVCTGSAILARTRLLDMKKATTNKQLLEWAAENNPDVEWLRRARWAVDGKFYTSSGVTAGIDMALGFIADYFDMGQAMKIATYMEHVWNPDKEDDPFAVE